LHYSYIAPQYQAVDLGIHSEIFQYTSRSTPFRKFKSSLPFLLSQASDKSLPWATIADAGFSVFTVLDDICDSRDIRYGKPTALLTFGLPNIATWVTGACETLSRSASSLNEPAGIEIRKSFSQFVEAQYHRLSNRVFNEKERYLDTAYYRTRFLEVIWTTALQCADCYDEANFVRENYVHLSILGQLVNDYYDLNPPTHQGAAKALRYSDLQNKKVNYGWMLIWDHLKASERHLIEHLVQDGSTDIDQPRLDILVKKTCGDTLLLCEIENRYDSLIDNLGNLNLNQNIKTILLEWYYRQFMAMLPLEHSYKSNYGDVFNALEMLTEQVG
jgi:geranylgeranyl pyrophosphate synthase